MINQVNIFTDGACRGNPGPGGWAAILRYNKHEKTVSGAEAMTTNNRMELTAAVEALRNLTRASNVVLVTDSMYVRDGITKWITRWKANSWKTAAKKAVKNQDLWKQLDELAQHHTIEWRWIKAHDGHPENERVDELARAAIDTL